MPETYERCKICGEQVSPGGQERCKVKPCRVCGQEIHADAFRCSHCGAAQQRVFTLGVMLEICGWAWILLGWVGLYLAAFPAQSTRIAQWSLPVLLVAFLACCSLGLLSVTLGRLYRHFLEARS